MDKSCKFAFGGIPSVRGFSGRLDGLERYDGTGEGVLQAEAPTPACLTAGILKAQVLPVRGDP